MSATPMNNETLDVRGQICPSTLLTVLREINRLKAPLRAGQTSLVVLTSNRDSTATIPEAARNMGYEVEVVQVQGDYRITIGKDLDLS